MGERELFEYWSDTYKVHHVDWTQEKAAIVLETWQNKFAEEVRKLVQKGTKTTPYSVYAFSTATLNDILKQFSELNIVKVVVGYAIMVSVETFFSYLQVVGQVPFSFNAGRLPSDS